MKKESIKRAYVLTTIILIVILLLREGCNSIKTHSIINEMQNYKTEAQTYKTKLGLEVSSNRALALETKEQIIALMASNDTLKEWMSKFKKIKSGVVVRETTIVREVAVPFDKPIPCDFKPFPVSKINKDFQFFTTVSNTGINIDSLKIPNESKIVIGEKREGFLRMKKQLVIDINNTNPYIQTSNISGFVYEPKKKWYERPLVNFAIGLGAGYIGKQIINK